MKERSSKVGIYNIIPLVLIVFAVISRLIPHPPNFTPITAIALFGGYSFSNRWSAIFLPLVIMFISDLFIGFHSTIWAVYLSFVLITLLGFLLRSKFSYLKLVYFASGSSLLFFLITNFAVWMTSGMYPHTLQGLLQCYFLGLPFYKTSPLEFFALSFIGDLVYSFAIFSAFHLASKLVLKHRAI
jgi:hypothetical protein